jgi:hypothetical protein
VTQQPGGSGPDLIGEFQRWLFRSSARGVGRQVTGQIRSALGQNQKQQSSGDVWETATTEPPDEAPECAWCPLCRAARLLRESKPGRDTRVTAVSDALGTVVQDAFSVLEAALATTGRAASGADARRAGAAGADTDRPGAAKPGPGGQPAPAQPKPADVWTAAQPSKPEDAPATTQPKPAGPAAAADNGHGTAEPGTGGEGAGTAAQGPGKGAAPESPDGSPHEPDDRG